MTHLHSSANAGPNAAWEIADYSLSDAPAIDRLALSAFAQYREHYLDWEGFARRIGAMSQLGSTAQLIVARAGGEIAGAVAYVGPDAPKAEFFPQDWAILRMLVVARSMRGQGIGRVLTEECIRRARRDGASVVGLHTSPIMATALAMYQRLGFRLVSQAPDIHGVEYGIYAMDLVG